MTKRWSNETVAKLVDESSLYMTGKGHRKYEDNVNPLFGVKFSRNYFPISYLNYKIPPNYNQFSVNFQVTLKERCKQSYIVLILRSRPMFSNNLISSHFPIIYLDHDPLIISMRWINHSSEALYLCLYLCDTKQFW